jgi:beta-mannosidase
MKPKNSGVSFCHFMLHTPDMKWAVVDFYLQPKKSFEYVRRTFQPLLVSLKYSKRRWNPGETFRGEIWVVNDLYKQFPDCTVAIRFLDDKRRVFHEATKKVGDVRADSSTKFSQVAVKVPGKRGDRFHVEMRLLDGQGTIVSENQYFLLVDDQQQAADLLKAMGQEARRRTEKGGGTIRYFEQLQGDRYVPTKLLDDFR